MTSTTLAQDATRFCRCGHDHTGPFAPGIPTVMCQDDCPCCDFITQRPTE